MEDATRKSKEIKVEVKIEGLEEAKKIAEKIRALADEANAMIKELSEIKIEPKVIGQKTIRSHSDSGDMC